MTVKQNQIDSVKEVPQPLGKWLELVNTVPIGPEHILRGWEIFVSNAYYEITGEQYELIKPLPPEMDYGQRPALTYEQQEALVEATEKATQELKIQTSKYLDLYSYLFELKDYPAPENIYDEIRYTEAKKQYARSAYLRYERFIQMRHDLRFRAQECMWYQRTGQFNDNEEVLERLGFFKRRDSYPSKFVIKNGLMDFESELISALRGVPADRLKICPICDEIFWAKKVNAMTCGKDSCVNTLQNQKRKARKESNK